MIFTNKKQRSRLSWVHLLMTRTKRANIAIKRLAIKIRLKFPKKRHMYSSRSVLWVLRFCVREAGSSSVALCSLYVAPAISKWLPLRPTGQLLSQVQTIAWVRRSASLASCSHHVGWRRRGRGTPPCRSGSLASLLDPWRWGLWCPEWNPLGVPGTRHTETYKTMRYEIRRVN